MCFTLLAAMLRLLLTCLVAFGAGSLAEARSERPGQSQADCGPKPIGATSARPVAAPVTKPQAAITLRVLELGSLRIVGSYQLLAHNQGHEPDEYPSEAPRHAQTDSTEEAVLRDIRDLYPETADLPVALALNLRRPAAPLGQRRLRTRLVRTGRWTTSRQVVESLTCTDTGPLVLARLPATDTTPAQMLAGPGYDRTTPLCPLELTQAAVLRLCGERARQVRAYAMLYYLHFEQAAEVARLLDYYNRLAVVQE